MYLLVLFNMNINFDSTYKYKGGKFYCDTSISYIFISHQVTLSSKKTISSELKFDKEGFRCWYKNQKIPD